MGIAFEWDEGKRERNLAKHGVDFTVAPSLAWNRAITVSQVRDGELRFASLATFRLRLPVIIWVQRGTVRRVISLRRANDREMHRYAKAHLADP